MIENRDAVKSLARKNHPNSSVRIDGKTVEDLSGLTLGGVNSKDLKFTWDDVLVEKAKLQDDYDAKKYQRDRAFNYPPLAEQMDILYHGGIDALKAELKKTKDKYPKP